MAKQKITNPDIAKKRRILRFWAWVDRSGGEDACWPWLGCRNEKGYGKTCFMGRRTTAPRIAYELYTGERISDHQKARHTCDNPPCCNPRHIIPGTQKQNLDDMRGRGRDGDHRVFGEHHGRCVLTDTQVAEIRDLYARGSKTQRELAADYGIGRSHIYRIVNGKSRTVTGARQTIMVPGHNKKPGRPRVEHPKSRGRSRTSADNRQMSLL